MKKLKVSYSFVISLLFDYRITCYQNLERGMLLFRIFAALWPNASAFKEIQKIIFWRKLLFSGLAQFSDFCCPLNCFNKFWIKHTSFILLLMKTSQKGSTWKKWWFPLFDHKVLLMETKICKIRDQNTLSSSFKKSQWEKESFFTAT